MRYAMGAVMFSVGMGVAYKLVVTGHPFFAILVFLIVANYAYGWFGTEPKK